MHSLVAVAHADDDVLRMLVEFLNGEGFEAVPCASSAALLAVAHSTLPQLTVIDLELRSTRPSWDLVRHLRDDPCCRNMPFIALTTEHRRVPPRPENCHRGCVILTEPFELRAIVGTIRSLLPVA